MCLSHCLNGVPKYNYLIRAIMEKKKSLKSTLKNEIQGHVKKLRHLIRPNSYPKLQVWW